MAKGSVKEITPKRIVVDPTAILETDDCEQIQQQWAEQF